MLWRVKVGSKIWIKCSVKILLGKGVVRCKVKLLKHFGGIGEVKKASVADLAKVPNISKKVAEAIYSALYNE